MAPNAIILNKLDEFDPDKLTIDIPKLNAKDKTPVISFPIYYDGKPLWIKTPKVVTPFGFTDYQDNKKFSIPCNISDTDEDFIELLKTIEETICDKIYEHVSDLGLYKSQKEIPKDINAFMDNRQCTYLKLLKYSDQYGFSIAPKVFSLVEAKDPKEEWKVDKPNIVIYDKHRKMLNDPMNKSTAKDSEIIKEIIGKRSTIQLVFSIRGIMKSQVGLSIKTNCIQCMVIEDSNSRRGATCLFDDSDDDIILDDNSDNSETINIIDSDNE